MNMKLTKKELLASPQRDFKSEDRRYKDIMIIPARTKHDSGWMHQAVIGHWVEDEKDCYEICAYPDDICWVFPNGIGELKLRTDCFYPQGILRFWGKGYFTVGDALSSTDVCFYMDN